MRTFVFISDIPDFLLQPLPLRHDDAAATSSQLTAAVKPGRDVRYERLRRLLAEYTSGVMLVMHLETRGYGLALYTSEAEALAACRTRIVPTPPSSSTRHIASSDNNNNTSSGGGGDDDVCRPLRLRIVERERPPPPEAVYSTTVMVEGECVDKRTLATTRGLELVYRGKAVARWCAHTRAGEDCPFGTSCFRVHRAACQRTVRKRPRSLDSEEAAVQSMLASVEARRRLQTLLCCRKTYEEALLSTTSTNANATSAHDADTLRLLPCMYVPVTTSELQTLFAEYDDNSDNNNNTASMHTQLEQRILAAAATTTASSSSLLSSRSFFVRLSCPGGAPWDWALCDDDDNNNDNNNNVNNDNNNDNNKNNNDNNAVRGLTRLRRRCPPPPRGTPTPLERDVYIQRVWYACNQLNRFATVAQAVHALACSARVRRAVAGLVDNNNNNDNNNNDDAMACGRLYVCVHPWLYLPTVGCEVSVFVERAGARLRAVVQRYGQLRCMLPTSLLTSPSSSRRNMDSDDDDHDDAATRRFALLGSNVDADAEAALQREVQLHGKAFMYAARSLCSLLQRKSNNNNDNNNTTTATITDMPCLPAGAALCARLALMLPTTTTTATTTTPRVVVLSLSSYERALESCALYGSMTHRHQHDDSNDNNNNNNNKSDDTSVAHEVTWNLHRHQHVPLLDHDVLRRLQQLYDCCVDMLTRKRTRNASSAAAAVDKNSKGEHNDDKNKDNKTKSSTGRATRASATRTSPRKSGTRAVAAATTTTTTTTDTTRTRTKKTVKTTTKKSATPRPPLSALTIATDDRNSGHVVPTAVRALESVVLRTRVIAPDVSGVRCLALGHGERELLVARENGSLVLYRLCYFQNLPHWTRVRHTGGRVRRSITRVAFVPRSAPVHAGDDVVVPADAFVVVSYLSGQVVLYDSATLAPVHVCERSGGAVWDVCLHMHNNNNNSNSSNNNDSGAGSGVVHVYGAMASNAWHVWQLRMPRRTRRPVLELLHILPGVPGATRALSVTCAHTTTGMTTTTAMACMIVGTDDAGNVHAWRPPCGGGDDDAQKQQQQHGSMTTTTTTTTMTTTTTTSAAHHGLSSREHASLWVRRLPRGIALCCAIATGVRASDVGVTATTTTSSPHDGSRHNNNNGSNNNAAMSGWHSCCAAVAVGTSLGEVVLLHCGHGAILRSFAQHAGPVSTLLSDGVCFYASGWHESLRCYRSLCDVHSSGRRRGGGDADRAQTSVLDGSAAAAAVVVHGARSSGVDAEWYAAEVKRRTHYHEATQLLFAAQRTLLLSGARDGTIMFAPVATLFTQPAQYVSVTTQSFAFASRRNVLLHTRYDRVEAFVPDAALRHWTPLFAHRLSGGFHVAGLWCDAALRCFVVATDERAVVVRVQWRSSSSDDDGDDVHADNNSNNNNNTSSSGVYDIRRLDEVAELPTRRGVIDVCCVDATTTTTTHADDTSPSLSSSLCVYVLTDDGVTFVTPCATQGAPVVHTRFATTQTTTTTATTTAAHNDDDVAHMLRPQRVLCDMAQRRLTVYGLHGMWQCALSSDGTPRAATQTLHYDDAYTLVHAVPTLSLPTTTTTTTTTIATTTATTIVGLRAHVDEQQARYYTDIDTPSTRHALASSLPHDTHFIARLPLRASTLSTFAVAGGGAATADKAVVVSSSSSNSSNTTMAATTQTRATASNDKDDGDDDDNDGSSSSAALASCASSVSNVYLGYFSRGLLVASAKTWRMAARMSVEAAFVMRDGEHILVLERNLERTLESLPLCWKVRRFGN